MPKKYRLTGSEFRELLKKRPKKFHGELFSLSLYPLADDRGPKIGIVVPKKVAQKAASRNLLERRCRAVIKNELKHLRSDGIYVFHAKKDAASLPYVDVKKDILALFGKTD